MSSVPESFVEVRLADPQTFLKVKETLERIGIASADGKKLYQSCHILHKKGQYWIVHFKEMFVLDRKETDFTELDLARRNKIVKLLEEWGLVNIVDRKQVSAPVASMSQIRIIPYKERSAWTLEAKYSIGKPKSPEKVVQLSES